MIKALYSKKRLRPNLSALKKERRRNCVIFHTVNAGLYIDSGRTALLIDGIHEGPSIGMPAMPEGLFKDILFGKGMFSRLDGLLFTHLHPDHYDEDKVLGTVNLRPETGLWGPGLTGHGTEENRDIPGGCAFRIGDLQISAYVTKHSGAAYKDIPHRSFLIRCEESGGSVFIAGDAVFSPDLAGIIKENAGNGGTVHAAFINVYQLLEEPSREFLLALAPERLLLYHRPLPGDDTSHYSHLIRYALRHKPLNGYTIELPEIMSRIPDRVPG